MMRYLLAAAAILQPAPAAAVPLAQVLLGTVRDTNDSAALPNGYVLCGFSTRLLPGTAMIVDQGPALTLWRQNRAAGPVAITLPAFGRAVVPDGAPAAWTYYAAGTAVLVFTSPTAGGVTFVGHAVAINTARIAPAFTGYSAQWDTASRLLTVSFTLKLGECSLPVSATYRG